MSKKPRTPVEVEQAFRARVEELGGRVIGTYVNNRTPVDCICRDGHPCRPMPCHIARGVGLCRRCAGLDPATAEAAFRARIAELGGTVIGEYAGTYVPVLIRCSAGHLARPRPGHVRRGVGPCRRCARRDPVASEAAFRTRVAALGGLVVGPYVNSGTPIACVCSAGHECRPTPDKVKECGNLPCLTCAGQDFALVEAAFRAQIVKLGGRMVGSYVNAYTPVECICPAGHRCQARPSSVRAGEGMCRYCRGKVWNAFYVATNDAQGRVKFGITSGDPRARLASHRRAGYRNVVRTLPDLPAAPALERAVLDTLKLAGISPVQGREYYDLAALPVILDIVDNWQETAA